MLIDALHNHGTHIMRMHAHTKGLILSLLMTFIVPVFGDNKPWTLEKNAKGIQVFTSKTKGSAIKSFRGVVTLDNSINSVIAVISDIPSYPRWMHNCKSARTLKKVGENQLYNHIVNNMPWPVLNRDSIVHSVLTEDKVKKKAMITFTSKPNFIKKSPKTVRITHLQGYWQLSTLENGKLKVVYQVSADPGGSIPKWVVNSMATDIPFNTLNNLRKVAKEAQYN